MVEQQLSQTATAVNASGIGMLEKEYPLFCRDFTQPGLDGFAGGLDGWLLRL
jgi:hypothetical protein